MVVPWLGMSRFLDFLPGGADWECDGLAEGDRGGGAGGGCRGGNGGRSGGDGAWRDMRWGGKIFHDFVKVLIFGKINFQGKR